MVIENGIYRTSCELLYDLMNTVKVLKLLADGLSIHTGHILQTEHILRRPGKQWETII